MRVVVVEAIRVKVGCIGVLVKMVVVVVETATIITMVDEVIKKLVHMGEVPVWVVQAQLLLNTQEHRVIMPLVQVLGTVEVVQEEVAVEVAITVLDMEEAV